MFWRWEVCGSKHVSKSLIRVIFSDLWLLAKKRNRNQWNHKISLAFLSHLWGYNVSAIINIFRCSKCFQHRTESRNCFMTLLLLLSRAISSLRLWSGLLLVKCVNSSSKASTWIVRMLLSLEWNVSCHSYLQIWHFSKYPRGSVCFILDSWDLCSN